LPGLQIVYAPLSFRTTWGRSEENSGQGIHQLVP